MEQLSKCDDLKNHVNTAHHVEMLKLLDCGMPCIALAEVALCLLFCLCNIM